MPFSTSSFSMRSLLSARSEATRADVQLATGASDPCTESKILLRAAVQGVLLLDPDSDCCSPVLSCAGVIYQRLGRVLEHKLDDTTK